MTTRLRAQFDGKVLVPQEPVDLAPGQMVQLQVTPVAEEPIGSGAAILRALDALPPIPREDVEELERLIEEGKLPVNDKGCFDDLNDEHT
jgi:hypothetical protein